MSTSTEERELARLVALWPDTAENAALEHAPQRVALFLSEMANATRALLSSTRPTTTKPALDVLRAAQITATNALRVLGMTGDTRF
jgi:arginyl-tRNA synthetase